MRILAAWCVGILGLAALFFVLWPRQASTEAEREALAEGRTILVYWDRHSGHEHESRRALIAEFNRNQNKIFIRPLSIGYNACMEKLLTSISGGAPPDLCGLDASMVAQLVAQGCFLPIEDRMAEVPALAQAAFIPFCWNEASYDGHVWGIPTTVDTYCLLWNKNAFRKAGLDPERPPQTIKELEDYAARLTIQDSSGIRQIGFLPWQPWDQSTMWGLLFGGKWYDQENDRFVCAEDANIVRMLYWQRSFSINPNGATAAPYALDPQKFLSFQSGFGAYMSANNPFYSGKIAMISEGEWQVTFIPKYAPDLDWGVAPMPTPEGAEPCAYGGACVMDCIPRGCKHPDAAWEYLKWFYSPRPNGGTSPASDYNYAIHNVPTRTAEARQDRFIRDPKFRVFVDVLTTRNVVTPPITPVTQYFGDETDRQRERVVFWKTTPEEAAREVQNKVNEELSDVRRLQRRTRS